MIANIRRKLYFYRQMLYEIINHKPLLLFSIGEDNLSLDRVSSECKGKFNAFNF